MRGFRAVLRKERLQMLRDRGTLRFALMVPVFQLVLFGLIDTNVEDVPTAVFDQSKTPESRELIDAFENTSLFRIARHVPSRAALREAVVAGQVSIGIEVPPDFARDRLYGRTARVLVLIDGSDSTLSSQTLAAANGLGLSRSLAELSREEGLPEIAEPRRRRSPSSSSCPRSCSPASSSRSPRCRCRCAGSRRRSPPPTSSPSPAASSSAVLASGTSGSTRRPCSPSPRSWSRGARGRSARR